MTETSLDAASTEHAEKLYLETRSYTPRLKSVRGRHDVEDARRCPSKVCDLWGAEHTSLGNFHKNRSEILVRLVRDPHQIGVDLGYTPGALLY